MGIIDTGLLMKGIKSDFFEHFRGAEAATRFLMYATRIASNADKETYKWLGSVPRMREWGTGRLAKDLITESYIVENLKYEATLEVDRDELADDQTGQIRVRTQELAVAAATHKDFLISQLLKNGGSAGFHSYDGVPFFSDTHASGKSGNQDNDLSASAANPAAPTSSEFKAALQAAVAALLSFKDDQGDPMLAMDQTGLRVVVPPEMLFAAREAIGAAVINNTTNTDQGLAEVDVFPWLAGDSTMFYLLKPNLIVRPFIFQDREPLESASLERGSEEEFKREKYLFGVRARYAMTYGLWQAALRTTFV